MPNVTMPDGVLVSFPDEMPKAEIRALIEKKFPNAQRQALADTGEKPYENLGQAALKGVTNLPQAVAGSANSAAVLAAEGVKDVINKEDAPGKPYFPILTPLSDAASYILDTPARIAGAVVNAIPGANESINTVADTVIADQSQRRKESDATLAANAPDVAPGSVEDIAYQVTMAGADMAAPMALSVLVRNAAPMAAYGAVRSGAEGYQKARDAGLDPDKARLAAGLYAAAEAVTEGISGTVLLNGGKTLIGAVLKGAGIEGVTEGATEALQAAVDAGIIGEDMTLADAMERVRQAAIVGGIVGGPFGAIGQTTKPPADPNPVTDPAAAAVAPADEVPDPVAIENQFALPAPEILLALPAPEAPPNIARRQAPAPEQPVAAAIREEAEAAFQAQSAVQRTRQAETAELLKTARETVTPLGTFSPAELDAVTAPQPETRTVDNRLQVKFGKDGQWHDGEMQPDGTIVSPGADADRRRAGGMGQSAVQRVNLWRMRTGRPLDAPITIEDMANAKVPRTIIDNVIAARRPMTAGEVLSPADVRAIATAKNIIEDNNFKELAYRTTGARDISRMNQVQLKALQSTLEALPGHAKPVTLPIADTPVFNEGQYNKAVDALRAQGRFTLKAIKDATGLTTDKDAHAVRDAMVRRGQLVKRSEKDYRLYDVLGTERQPTPEDLPKGAFSEHVIKRLPVNKVQVKVNGKSVGLFASGTEARDKVRAEREKDPKAKIELGQTEDVAYGVMENRYDEKGTLLGQVVVDTARDETAARKLADQRNNPAGDGARYVQTAVEPTGLSNAASKPLRPPAPPALAGRTKEIADNLNRIAKQRALPLLGTKVTIQNEIRAPNGESVEGVYLQNLIALSAAHLDATMTTAQVTDALAQVMDHELIHALKQAGVLNAQTEGWKTLARYTSRTKRPGENVTYFDWAQRAYAGVPGYTTRADFEEEAIAEAFRVWAANKRNVVGKPATVFRQLVEWFKRLFSTIPNDVFSDIETGKLVRDALTPPGANQPRAKAGKEIMEAQIAVQNALAADDIDTARTMSRQFLRARAQAREDRYGRSGPKTVIGTTPERAYDAATKIDRAALDEVVDRYRQRAGLNTTGLATYLPEDIDFLKRVADAQQSARHNPEALDVAKSYRALITETKEMFDSLGPIAVERYAGDGAPYASPEEMFADIAEGRLQMRLSDDLFGPSPDNPNHPMNVASGRVTVDGIPLTNNDLFRIVHDIYGRAPNGLRSDARGDFNAYHEHARLLSPEARGALATETLAQSAWHHYGPHLRRADGTVPRGDDIDYLPPSRKEFAQQKAFLLPDAIIDADRGWKLADDAARAVDDASQADLQDAPRFSLFKDRLPGGDLYGNPNRSPGGALSKPETPAPAFTNERDGNRFFGGEMADEQLRMAVEGTDGTTLVYLTPDEYTALADQRLNPEQEVYDAAIAEGYKFNTLPSLVVDGYAGIVRAPESDGAFAARSLAGQADLIPVVLYPKRKENLGLVTAIEANGMKVPWPHVGRQENFIDNRGPRYSVGSDKFKAWFGDSKVVDAEGAPLVVYHGTPANFNAFDPEGTTEGGFFFSVSREHAQDFVGGSATGRVIEAYLSVTNPSIVEGESLPLQHSREDIEEIIEAAKANGNDGVLIRNFRDMLEDRVADTFIAFEPTQIKSAVENNGNYDAADPDIRYSLNAPYGSRVPQNPPDTANIVDQRIDSWVGKRLAGIGRSKRALPVIGSVFDARIKFQDKMLSVKEMVENIKDMGGKVDDTTDVYVLEQLAGSRTVHLIEHRTNKLYEPLFEALEAATKGPNAVSVKEFEDFLYARHAPERNTYLRSRGSKLPNPSGMSDAEAEAILDKAAIDGKYGKLQELAKMADAIAKDTTSTRVEAGLITQAAADSSPYEHYVPLRGKTEEDLDPEDVYDPQTRARSGKGYTVGGREDRAVTGRERKAGDIISHLMLQNTEAVIRSEKNRVALAFMRLMQENPQTGYGNILKTAPTRQVVGANGMIREAGDPSYRQRPDVFTAKYNGKEIIAQVNDPRVARAMKSDYVSQSGAFINFLGRINRFLATINTSWNPEFLISNLARDMQTAGILGAQYDIKGLSGKIIRGAPSAMLGIREVLRDGTATTPMARAFKEMQDAGGTTEFLGLHDLDTHVRRLRRVAANTGLNPTARQALERVRMIGDFIDDYNKVAENAFRLGAYVAARDAGVSIDKAAFLAKNLTVNFNKGGENKSLMNSLYLFYNASISGTFVLLNGLKNKRVQRIVAGIAVAGMLSDLLNRALSGDEDDNGVKDYDDIPEYILETNWVFMMPGSKDYIAIPMPYGFNVFHNLGRNLSNAFSGSPVHNPGKSAMSMGMTALGAFNPMGGSESILNFISPTFADPFMDLISNEDFAGNQIVPERPTFGQPVPESQKYWANTGDIPKWIADQLNRATGGNEVRKGTVDVSPEVLQFWFEYATGAVGKFTTRNVGLSGNLLQGNFEDIKIGDIPFARRVVGTVDNRGNTERYYENATEVKTVAEELKLAEEQGNAGLYRMIVSRSPAQVQLISTFEEAEKGLADLRTQIRDLRANETLPAPRKRELIRSLQQQQDRIMATLNKVYFAATGTGR